MNQTEQILSQLRDIQAPPPPESVSVWLITANLVLLLLVLLGLYRRWHRQRQRWRRDALNHIRRASQMQPAIAVAELARLLRQIMIYRHYDISVAGDAWLAGLDAAFDTHWFTQAEGRAFGTALYRPPSVTDAQLQLLCERLKILIRKLPSRPPGSEPLHNHLSAS